MSNWTFWEWVAYTIMFVAAVIIAADQGVKLAPDLLQNLTGIICTPYWAFAPLGLILLATAILMGREFGWLGVKTAKNQFIFHDTPPHIVVAKKTFTNERILLDGHAYRNCTFENVTFVFNGTSPFEFSRNKINGTMRFASDNPSVQGTFNWFRGFGLINQVEFTNDSGSIIEPPKPPPRSA